MNRFIVLPLALALAACGKSADKDSAEPAGSAAAPAAETAAAAPDASTRLAAVLAAQPDDVRARYQHRHPQETLEFFGIEPGMTVIEALPGGGWYTKILLPYLGADGKVIGADYSLEMFPLFGFFTEERLKAKETWREDWTAEASGWRADGDAAVDAYVMGSMPESLHGTVDAALFIRALHNLNRFENDGGFLTTSLAEVFAALKPGGIVGVVQHHAPEALPDEWASGAAGYLKQSAVIERFESAGFEFVGMSNVNANPADQPTAEDIVWRLPPTLATSRENPELAEQMKAIGESNRMTLLFRKPE